MGRIRISCHRSVKVISAAINIMSSVYGQNNFLDNFKIINGIF